jgi:hypothetical protein
MLHVVEALAGSTAVVKLWPDDPASLERVATGPELVGLAFTPAGGLVLATTDALWAFGRA